MKILITGGTGVIGYRLVKYFETKTKVFFTYNKSNLGYENSKLVNISNLENVKNCIINYNPDVIIHTAALTNVDYCEKNHKETNTVNIEGTNNIVNAAKNNNSKLVFISTAYVFDGKKKYYKEDDVPNPVNYYGYSKLEGEKIIKESGLDYLIIRTDQPYDWVEAWQRKNSILRAIEILNSHKTLNEIIDWKNTPTYIPDIIHATAKLIENKIESETYHIVGPDYLSRYEWSLMVAEIFDLDKTLIVPISSESLGLVTKRPNVQLDNSKITKLGINMSGVIEGMNKMKHKK